MPVAENKPQRTLFPAAVKPWLRAGLGVLLTLAIALILWRGPAILLDLENLAAWCF